MQTKKTYRAPFAEVFNFTPADIMLSSQENYQKWDDSKWSFGNDEEFFI